MTIRRLLPMLRVLISIGLLAFVFTRIHWGDVSAAIVRVRPLTLAAAVALALIGYWGRAVRWTWLLRRAGVAVSHATSYRLTLLGTFYGLVTPGRVGELGRVLHLDAPRARTLPSAVWDRLADILLLEALALPAFVALDTWHGPLLWSYLAIVAVTVLVVAAVDDARLLHALERRWPALARPLGAWRGGAAGMLRSAAFARGLIAGLFFYALNFAGAWLLLRDLAPHCSPALGLIFPVIILLGNLPIAFGGLGLREQVAAVAFGRFGASTSIGPVFSLLWFAIITLVPGLLGLALNQLRRGGEDVRLTEPAGAPGGGA